ncbi:hypothetical protein ABBQ32_009704 [Trebouxia sp. C0010 RCD-2024]
MRLYLAIVLNTIEELKTGITSATAQSVSSLVTEQHDVRQKRPRFDSRGFAQKQAKEANLKDS